MNKSLILFSTLLLSGGCGFGESIFIVPASTNVFADQTFTVDVDVDNIPDLADYQFSLTYNPNVLAAQSVTEGALFADTNSSFFDPGTIDNNAGAIKLVFDVLFDSSVTGPGTLATVQFEAISAGVTSLAFVPSDLILQDSQGNVLSVTANSSVITSSVNTVPESATTVLIGPALGLILIGAWRRRLKYAGCSAASFTLHELSDVLADG